MVRKNEIKFDGEVRHVKSKKLVSLDKEITVLFNTNQLQALDLGKIDSDVSVEVIVRW